MEQTKFRVIHGEDFDITLLPKIMEVDRACYTEQYVGELAKMEARYRQNPRTFVCVMDGDEVAGYINFFPVKPALWDEIVETGMVIRDDDIRPEELAEYHKLEEGRDKDSRSEEELNRLFIISIAIKPEYRGKEFKTAQILSDGFIAYLNQLKEEGYPVDAISGTAVSEDGKKFLRNHMFGAYREIKDGNVVYLCEGIYLERLLEKKLYFKTYRNDVYLFLPYADNIRNTRINKLFEEEKSVPDVAKNLLDALDDCLVYEYESDMVNELDRVYIGERLLMHTLDESYSLEEGERPHIVGEEKVYLSLLAHRASHMYVVMLFIPDSKYSASQLEDQLCQSYLKVRQEGDVDERGFYQYTDLNEFLRREYGLLPCGKGKSILCMSAKPDNDGEFLNILSAEAYNSMHQDFFIKYPQLLEEAQHNRAIYDYYETYMTDEVVAFILYDFHKLELKEREELTATYIFIAELVIFQNTALNKMTIKVSNALAHEGDVSYEYIDQLYLDYAKTVKFWQSNNFKYYGTRREADQIRDAFGNDELRSNYQEQQEFLEHMVEIKSAQVERRNGTVINVAATVLAVLQVKEYLVGLLSGLYGRMGIPIESAGSTFDVMVLGGGGLLLLVLYTLNKRNYYMRRRKLRQLKDLRAEMMSDEDRK